MASCLIPWVRAATWFARTEAPYRGIATAYRRLLEDWLPSSGEAFDDRPGMEIYRNSPLDTPEAELLTDLYVPLRAAPDH